jgi:predicted transcriptional regulator
MGMRPQDIAVLLKIIALGNKSWQNKDLAWWLHLSASEISESLNRSQIAGLIDPLKKKVYRQSLMEFLEHGLAYVFPAVPGARTQGIPTAHAHPFMKELFHSEEDYVWPSREGDSRGDGVDPLYPGITQSIKDDDLFYKLLALTDSIRVGRNRERKAAISELKKNILNES